MDTAFDPRLLSHSEVCGYENCRFSVSAFVEDSS